MVKGECMKAVAKIGLGLALVMVGVVGLASAAERHVPADYPTIQAAIVAAGNGDEIILAAGTYSGAGNKDLSPLGKPLTIRSTDPTDPDVVAATIINTQSTARAFYVGDGESNTTIIEGLTLQNGWSASGGAIKCYFSYPIIRYCRFLGNAVSGSGELVNGGALSIEGDPQSQVTVSHCYFSQNTCTNWGGAIYVETGLVMDNCVVAGNRTGNYGGGIYARNGNLSLDHCTFVGNYAGFSGGGIRLNGGTLTTANSIFWDNTVSDSGDAISLINQVVATVAYSNIDGDTQGMFVFAEPDCTVTYGQGNLTLDPQFTQEGLWNGSVWQEGTYTLRAGSPSINAGDPTFGGIGQFDLAGAPRKYNDRVDMGAYEKQLSPLIPGKMTAVCGSSVSGNRIVLRGTFNSDLPTASRKWVLAEQIRFAIGPFVQTLSTLDDTYRQVGDVVTYKGTSPGITALKVDFKKGTFLLTAKGMVLAGLANPVTVSMETLGSEEGEYSGQGQITVPKLSLKFLKDYADALTISAAKISGTGDNASLTLKGGITFALTPETLIGQTVTLYWGDEVVATFPGLGETFLGKNAKYTYRRPRGNTTGTVISAVLDLNQCVYAISLRGLTLNDRTGTVPLRITCGAFDETVDYTFPP